MVLRLSHSPLLAAFPLLLAACDSAPAPAPQQVAVEQSVKPGINKAFLDPDMQVATFIERFEGESREIFAQRARVARAVGLSTGMAVADVGAGTGFFSEMFARDVGAGGRVYSVDISPKMVAHIEANAARKKLGQIRAVLCTDRDVSLPPASVDAVFICDVYHHFEYPNTTMATIARAVKPGGSLVLVDFERIPGVTREWVMGHVRAGREVFTAEIEAAGFILEQEIRVPGLRENYVLRFRRK